ncbi:hypothetical protein O181_006410 [Austropuccinia psidii MF-1]|uniref:Uncharacterized protein n=1 Tax=Austropuccinia psidii MF-1 TaxID=1389203 RepID=A0A9Q3BKZ3_9BASI|nr:hypothetical protein [Austropuccinia psidii MF-1]
MASPQKTSGPFQSSITKGAIYGVIHNYAPFFSSNPMAAISNGYFSFLTGHEGTPSRGFLKAQGKVSQSQIPMTPSSNQWLFSITVFLQENTDCSFSRDIQEAIPKQCVKGQCCINPPWQANSFSTVLIHQDLYFHSYTMGRSFNPVHFPISQGIHSIRQ